MHVVDEAVLVVVDATNIERNLFLVTQVVETGLPLAVMDCTWITAMRTAGATASTHTPSSSVGASWKSIWLGTSSARARRRRRASPIATVPPLVCWTPTSTDPLSS